MTTAYRHRGPGRPSSRAAPATIGARMATATDTTTLTVAPREVAGSRATRRLRRSGQIPGIVYGGGDDPIPFAVESRELRTVLAHTGAVIELRIGDGEATSVVLKDLIRHPVSGDTVHLDFL